MARRIQEINAGSMADIAFLLLIFFLVTTTMDVDSGIQRVLPPMPDPNQKDEGLEVNKRNLMLVFVNKADAVSVGGQIIDVTMIKDKVKEFILNPLDDPNLPAKKIEQIDLIGDYPVGEGVVSLQNDRGTSYNMYIMVQNELTRAFNEVRNEVSMQKFGRRFDELSDDQRTAVAKAVPLKISEAEPRNIGGV